MTDTILCPDCGLPLPPDAPQGECPRCLLRAGFESQPAVAVPIAVTRTSSGHAHFIPPTVTELQQRIPQYEILELIGQGGMGAVYKARQRGLERLVAIKILPFEVSQSAAFAERFSREARALAMLSHPHIVAVHDFGQAEGMCYFVMEYVAGVNLRQALQAGKMNPVEALAIVPQICEALQFAHDEGVVHRDIKPENILIDLRGRVKIADFGLAKLLGTQTPEHSLTGTQQVMGTLRYMAPEQMFGSKEVDHRADIFSLGVVFYELLTGELPIGRFALPSKKSGVDVRLDDVVLRALESEPAERYQHVSDMKYRVEEVAMSGPRRAATAATQPAVQHPAQHGEWEQLLDETDRTIRLKQHALLLTGFGVAAAGVILLVAGPIVFAVPAITITALLWMVAGLHNQHWEVICAGQRIVFENQIFFGSHLYLNGRLARRGKFGYRNELAATLPDGSGRMVVALTEAGFWHFRCRLLLQPQNARPVSDQEPTPSAEPASPGFAGSMPHLLVCLALSLALVYFLLHFGPPFLTMIDGPDVELIRVGRNWDLGDTVSSITSSLIVILLVLGGGTAFAWWKFRTAGSKRKRDTGDGVPLAAVQAATSAELRLSQTALWGAILAPLSLITLLMISGSTIIVHRVDGDGQTGPPLAMRLVALVLLVPGIVGLFSPFATTLLGILAIAQIRNARGKLYGLPLAVFDALAYPLLVLDAVLLTIGYLLLAFVFSDVLQLTYNTPLRNWGPGLLTAVFLLPFVILLNVWLIRLTWQAANDGLAGGNEKKEPPPFQPQGTGKTSQAVIIVLVVLAIFAIPTLLAGGVLAAYFFSESPPVPQGLKKAVPKRGLEPDTSWLESNQPAEKLQPAKEH